MEYAIPFPKARIPRSLVFGIEVDTVLAGSGWKGDHSGFDEIDGAFRTEPSCLSGIYYLFHSGQQCISLAPPNRIAYKLHACWMRIKGET
jgi:hypothetical protein